MATVSSSHHTRGFPAWEVMQEHACHKSVGDVDEHLIDALSEIVANFHLDSRPEISK